MPVLKYDLRDQNPEDSAKGGGTAPKHGTLVRVKITKCDVGYKKGDDNKPDKTAPRIEIEADIVDAGEHKGYRFWEYITLDPETLQPADNMKWKYDQVLLALKVSTVKREGSFDTAKQVGKFAMVKVKGDSFTAASGEVEYRAKVGTWLPDAGGNGTEKKTGTKTKASDPVAEIVTLGMQADAEDEDAMADLTARAEALGVDPNDYPTWVELEEYLLENEAAFEDVTEPEPEPEESDADQETMEQGEAADGGDDAAATALTEKAEALGLDPNDYSTWTGLAEEIVEKGAAGGATEEVDYNDLTDAQLKKECTDRGLKTVGTRNQLIQRLEAHDAENPY